MATEVVISIDLGFELAAGATQTALLQTDGACILVCTTASSTAGATGRLGIIRFVRPRLTRFGMPNDEALGGHPLYACGLRFYSAGEVLDSAWKTEVESQNRKTFPRAAPWRCRHFVLAMKESTFECLADGFSTSVSTEPMHVILAKLILELT